MEKVTISKAKDEALDFFISAFGTSLGIVLMKLATKTGVNQWLVPGIGLVGGVGLRIMGPNAFLKSIGTGVGIAGAADLTKKGLDYAGTKIPALANLTKDVPNFSGFPSDPVNFQRGSYNAINSTILRGLRGVGDPVPSQRLLSSKLLR